MIPQHYLASTTVLDSTQINRHVKWEAITLCNSNMFDTMDENKSQSTLQ